MCHCAVTLPVIATKLLQLAVNWLHVTVTMQAETESQPRKRFGLFAGFRKRNRSENAVGRPSGFRLWSSKQSLAHLSPAIAECEDGDSGDDTFESPRYGMCFVGLCYQVLSLLPNGQHPIGLGLVQSTRGFTLSTWTLMAVLL